ncbi:MULTISPECIES: ABC transporter permease [Paenibacillus]|uniref:ABC transporter permease n=1 Tax=Paenibacillus campinasensis TaxID=66347 RepID=A0A268F390_9BACL|nr:MULTISPECIES: ABC transporter permease [Paenibacillus]MUG65981.1 ABC transporter permease subunit [Paenibacillus campinasensis]PAD79794.1 ABC transporter permease [Paenibacillus campinasensis]PAK53659.1 ABC transporter permease [Paenibacillus sp. 7541]
MSSLWPLIQNETIKIVKRKRFYVILLVLLVLVPMFTYAQMKSAERSRDKFNSDWRLELQQRITDNESSLSSDRIPDEWKRYRMIFIQQMRYYLEHDVNPNEPNGVTFTREFMNNSISLFIPLMIMAIASDIVSGERTTGTIKMLLTRPVKRWKVLLSKLVALLMFISLIVVSAYIIAYLVSGLAFGYAGFNLPIFTGFTIVGSEVDMSTVQAVPQWKYLLMQGGLVWYVGVCVGMLAFMVSVLVRSTAASIVIMMAALIAGNILTNMASAWNSAKYLFMVNLNLTDYLAGNLPPIEGMTLNFSLIVLAVWAALAILVSFSVFTRRDILN